LKWLKRAREAQMSHYDMATLLLKRSRGFGILVTAVTAFVGTSVFASLDVANVSRTVTIALGVVSAAAAALSALQTFLRDAERSERHRWAGARYGALRRHIEALLATGVQAHGALELDSLRDELDRLAEDSPNVPERRFFRTLARMRSDA
jgi:hypothetical protein